MSSFRQVCALGGVPLFCALNPSLFVLQRGQYPCPSLSENRNWTLKTDGLCPAMQYVEQTELEKHDGVSSGKYTIGLGQTKMTFCDDREGVWLLPNPEALSQPAIIALYTQKITD
jgi:hypothetical protein